MNHKRLPFGLEFSKFHFTFFTIIVDIRKASQKPYKQNHKKSSLTVKKP